MHSSEQELTPQVKRIVDHEVGPWLELFNKKSRDYEDNANVLGVRGQFADIWRKMHKLKAAMWEGKTLTSEQPEEVIRDLIAHLFLTLDMMHADDRASEEERARVERDGGWEELPEGIQSALIDFAEGRERVTRPYNRQEVRRYLAQHLPGEYFDGQSSKLQSWRNPKSCNCWAVPGGPIPKPGPMHQLSCPWSCTCSESGMIDSSPGPEHDRYCPRFSS